MITKASILLERGLNIKFNLYFIISGIVRGYYIDENGNDVTKCFSVENGFFSTEGLRTDGLSSFNIESLENCECIQIPYKMIRRIMKEDENIQDFFTHYHLLEMGKLESRTKNLLLKNAEERYIQFCEQFPKLHLRIEQKYIASYLGIRPESLSRIKKQMKNKDVINVC